MRVLLQRPSRGNSGLTRLTKRVKRTGPLQKGRPEAARDGEIKRRQRQIRIAHRQRRVAQFKAEFGSEPARQPKRRQKLNNLSPAFVVPQCHGEIAQQIKPFRLYCDGCAQKGQK